MNKKTPMITDRKLMHKRLTELCKKLNQSNYTNLSNALSELNMGKTYFNALVKSKIVFKINGYWKGSERLTENKLNEFVLISRRNITKINSRIIKGQSTIKFPKVNTTNKKLNIKKIDFIQRLKILLTGHL